MMGDEEPEFESVEEVSVDFLEPPLTPDQTIRLEALSIASVTCKHSKAELVILDAVKFEKYIREGNKDAER
jgi:hypothetical protein